MYSKLYHYTIIYLHLLFLFHVYSWRYWVFKRFKTIKCRHYASEDLVIPLGKRLKFDSKSALEVFDRKLQE